MTQTRPLKFRQTMYLFEKSGVPGPIRTGDLQLRRLFRRFFEVYKNRVISSIYSDTRNLVLCHKVRRGTVKNSQVQNSRYKSVTFSGFKICLIFGFFGVELTRQKSPNIVSHIGFFANEFNSTLNASGRIRAEACDRG